MIYDQPRSAAELVEFERRVKALTIRAWRRSVRRTSTTAALLACAGRMWLSMIEASKGSSMRSVRGGPSRIDNEGHAFGEPALVQIVGTSSRDRSGTFPDATDRERDKRGDDFDWIAWGRNARLGQYRRGRRASGVAWLPASAGKSMRVASGFSRKISDGGSLPPKGGSHTKTEGRLKGGSRENGGEVMSSYGLLITIEEVPRRPRRPPWPRHGRTIGRWPSRIVDTAGHLVSFEKMDDTQLGSVVVAQAKARAASSSRGRRRHFRIRWRPVARDGVCSASRARLRWRGHSARDWRQDCRSDRPVRRHERPGWPVRQRRCEGAWIEISGD